MSETTTLEYDAEFVATARTAMPRLIAALRTAHGGLMDIAWMRQTQNDNHVDHAEATLTAIAQALGTEGGGVNSIKLASPPHEDSDMRQTEECGRCAGVGRIAKPVTARVFLAERCPRCSGTGRVPYGEAGRRDD